MDECFENDGICGFHGSYWPCTTKQVLRDVSTERGFQFHIYGDNRETVDGTGPRTAWLLPIDATPASIVEEAFREEYEEYEKEVGAPTWAHLVREEVAEAFKEKDQAKLEKELLQVAALCVSWIEKIRERRQWAVLNEHGEPVLDLEWHCPADVVRGAHGFGMKQVTIVTRYPGEEWEEWG